MCLDPMRTSESMKLSCFNSNGKIHQINTLIDFVLVSLSILASKNMHALGLCLVPNVTDDARKVHFWRQVLIQEFYP